MGKLPKTMHHWSTIRGITERETGKATLYFGKILRFPLGQIDVVEEEEVMQKMTEELSALEDYEIIAGGVMERYEIVTDPDTGEAAAMWRVPCQSKAAGKEAETGTQDEWEVIEIKHFVEPPDELMVAFGGYQVLHRTHGPEAAQDFARKMLEYSLELLSEKDLCVGYGSARGPVW